MQEAPGNKTDHSANESELNADKDALRGCREEKCAKILGDNERCICEDVMSCNEDVNSVKPPFPNAEDKAYKTRQCDGVASRAQRSPSRPARGIRSSDDILLKKKLERWSRGRVGHAADLC